MNIILRPERNERTPRALKDALGPNWTMKRWPGFTSGQANFGSDFLMIYPEQQRVIVPAPLTETYAALRNYFQKNKPNQRLALGALGLPIAKCATAQANHTGLSGERFVVRPLRHEGGANYRLTQTASDFLEGEEYISELFPKEREYRLLYVFGQLTMMWQKRKAANETDDGPWGAEGHSAFLNIEDWASSYLFRHTDARQRIGDTFVARDSHIVAFDVLYSHSLRQYVVLESNTCPALYWSPTAIAKVAEAIGARPVMAAAPSAPQQIPAPVAAAVPAPPAAPTPGRTGSTASPQSTIAPANQTNRFSLRVPPRPVIRLITIDFFGNSMELTVPEIDAIISQLEEAKAA